MGVCASCCGAYTCRIQLSASLTSLHPLFAFNTFPLVSPLVSPSHWPSDARAGGSKSSASYEPLLLENEREAVADLLQYLESESTVSVQRGDRTQSSLSGCSCGRPWIVWRRISRSLSSSARWRSDCPGSPTRLASRFAGSVLLRTPRHCRVVEGWQGVRKQLSHISCITSLTTCSPSLSFSESHLHLGVHRHALPFDTTLISNRPIRDQLLHRRSFTCSLHPFILGECRPAAFSRSRFR